MRSSVKDIYLGLSALAVATVLVGAYPSIPAFAQSTSAASAIATVKALQEALNRQGIALPVTGVLDDETRSAIRKYQSQHHLPVSGAPDKATLDKLGVRAAAAAGPSATIGQAGTSTPGQTAAPQGQPPGGMMMNCPMLQGQMQGMMQMMQGMMQMMQMMQAQVQPGQMQPQQMPGQMQPGQPGQMPQGQMPQGQMQPGQMQPGQMQPGQMQPGQMRGPMQPKQN